MIQCSHNHSLISHYPQEGITKDLQHRSSCWLTISKLTCETGSALGLACGGICISVFVSFLICVYGNLIMIIDIRKGLSLDWKQMLPVAITFLFFFLVFDSADNTSREVDHYTFIANNVPFQTIYLILLNSIRFNKIFVEKFQ